MPGVVTIHANLRHLFLLSGTLDSLLLLTVSIQCWSVPPRTGLFSRCGRHLVCCAFPHHARSPGNREEVPARRGPALSGASPGRGTDCCEGENFTSEGAVPRRRSPLLSPETGSPGTGGEDTCVRPLRGSSMEAREMHARPTTFRNAASMVSLPRSGSLNGGPGGIAWQRKQTAAAKAADPFEEVQ